MIQLIYGTKGSGKTKKLLNMVAEEVKTAEGSVVFIDDDKRYLREVPSSVRFVDISEYGIDSADALLGFLCGMYAQNYDIGAYYIDALLKIVGKQPEELACFFKKLGEFCEANKINVVISVSAEAEEAPEYLKNWIV
ncbi:MAG: ATP-binding protein [Clostridia bacterium]|nr:ATP-binding protein [Clostridia bacterium]